jgi:hypothetical protein
MNRTAQQGEKGHMVNVQAGDAADLPAHLLHPVTVQLALLPLLLLLQPSLSPVPAACCVLLLLPAE